MNDPYKILGVSPTATDDEVKAAYRALARKYHPDKYRDSDLAEMAEEKMKEINSAYDEVQKLRSGRATGQGSGGYGDHPGGGFYGQATGGGNLYATARQLINLRRLAEAAQLLSTVPSADRGAEWHFLMGCVAVGRGFYVDAQQSFDTACGMDPGNPEYQDARERLRNRGNGFGTGQSTHTAACPVCEICTAFACADCCCSTARCCL